jgi:hypothetical protein
MVNKVDMVYIPHPHHRDAGYAAHKSQWSVSLESEISCFNKAVASEWLCNKDFHWGLCIHETSPSYLGVSQLPEKLPLFVAKFVSDAQNNWHGYPVAHWLAPFDKPSKTVVDKWKNAGLINGAQRARIVRGKLCSL